MYYISSFLLIPKDSRVLPLSVRNASLAFRSRQACPANRITYGLVPEQIVTEKGTTEIFKRWQISPIALMHVYVTQANFTTKPRFEIKNKRSFTEMNSQGSRVEKNTHAQKVQMQKILFTNEACW